MSELQKQLRQISRGLDTAAKGFSRLTEIVGEIQPEFGVNGGLYSSERLPAEGAGGSHDHRRRQPTADLPGSPQASTQALEAALTTNVEERAKDYLTESVQLFEDADRGIPELRDFSMRARSAYLAIWAGRGRDLQAKLEPWWEELPEGVEKSFRVFFGKLTTVTKRLRCEWVDALHRAWSTDWDIYVRFYQRRLNEDLPDQAQGEVSLSAEEDQMLARDRLDGLLQRNRPRPSDARQLIMEGSEVLDATDSVMADVLTQYASLLHGFEEFTDLLEAADLLDMGPVEADNPVDHPAEELDTAEALESATAD